VIVLEVAVAVLVVPQARLAEYRLFQKTGQPFVVVQALVDQVFCQVFQERHSPTVPVPSG
jgi:hypothetical protein